MSGVDVPNESSQSYPAGIYGKCWFDQQILSVYKPHRLKFDRYVFALDMCDPF